MCRCRFKGNNLLASAPTSLSVTGLAARGTIQGEIIVLLFLRKDFHPLVLLRLHVSQLGNLFTIAASPSLEADHQKYQKISANEESPAATCCTNPT